MESAIGFELAADAGDHLLLAGQRFAVRQQKAGIGIEAENIEIQPFVDHPNS